MMFKVTLIHLEAKFKLEYWGLEREDLRPCMDSCAKFAQLAFAISDDFHWEAYKRVGTENVLVATLTVYADNVMISK